MIMLFNPFKTQYTLEKGYWLESKLERLNMAGLQCHAIKNKNRNHSIDYLSQEMKDDWYINKLSKF